MTLSQTHLDWFQAREIDPETLVKVGVYSGTQTPNGVVASPTGNVLVFPFKDRGITVQNKYRGPNKKFWQDAGGRRTFWNADVMDDPALEAGQGALIITEGEIDAISAIGAGFPFTVSVPDGAPSVPQGSAPDKLDPLDPDQEANGKFEFMYNNRDRLKRIKRFILAVDADAPGQRLAAELVRRLSPARCSFVVYPKAPVVPVAGSKPRPCKDLNEVLVYLGPERVAQLLNTAKPYPVRGLYRLSEYPDMPEIETFATGFEHWESALRMFAGAFVVVTGVPSHGKSTWVLNLLYQLRKLHGWRAAICSPEMPAVPILRDRFRRMVLDRRPLDLDREEVRRADAWIEEAFTFIDTDPTGMGDSDEPFDLDWIIDRATDAVLRDGIRVLVIDPWNEIDHARGKNESGPDYIARGIRALKRFGRLYGVVVIVVAHPTKEVNRDGKQRTPSLYDVEGAAHWYNKADIGVVIERTNDEETFAHVQKVRFEETGKRGKYRLLFHQDTGTYSTVML